MCVASGLGVSVGASLGSMLSGLCGVVRRGDPWRGSGEACSEFGEGVGEVVGPGPGSRSTTNSVSP